jgi:rubredoxin
MDGCGMSEHTTIDGNRVYGDSADPDGPWTVGVVRCRSCGHVWTAVRPFSADDPMNLVCPSCSMRGAEEVER